MAEQSEELTGPDLAQGVSVSEVEDGGMLLGHADGEAVLLARRGDEVFAISAHCTHYHGPLAEGILVGETVRCPWHHACFNLRTGEAEKAPALLPLACWNVARDGDTVRVTGQKDTQNDKPPVLDAPKSVVIVGAGAAGVAAAEMLRREGYTGPVTLIGAEDSLPPDRPNLSKDYLAGTAPEEWVPLLPEDFYTQKQITRKQGVLVTGVDTERRTVTLNNGETLPYGKLLLATGADPVHPAIEGANQSHVHYLRTFADSKAIIAAAESAKNVVIIGASFIGLEVAASLRNRDLNVQVVSRQPRPLESVFGSEIGDYIRTVHESHGVRFYLETEVQSIGSDNVTLTSGETLTADLVVIGVGVRPATGLADQAGIETNDGVIVNEYLETSIPGVYAAGDIARYPDTRSGKMLRIEHWVVAERQGQTAAKNMLNRQVAFTDPPFFWSAHYDVILSYVGHSEKWDRLEIEGSIADQDCKVTYLEGERAAAVLTIFRDQDSLRAEAAMEGLLPAG